MSSITGTITRQESILRLQIGVEERAQELFDEIERSNVLSEEELEPLEAIVIRFRTHPNQALTVLLCQMIETAIIDREEEIEIELFVWQKRLQELIRETLPRESSLEEHLTSARKAIANLQAMQRREALIVREGETKIENLYAVARQFDEENSRGREALESSLRTLQEERLQAIDETTERVRNLAQRTMNAVTRQVNLTERSIETIERGKKNEEARCSAYEDLEKVLKSCHV